VTSVGAGLSIIKTNTAGSSTILRNLVAGTNITLDNTNVDQITINSTSGGGTTTLSIDSASPQLTATLTGSNYVLGTRGSDTVRIGSLSGGVGTGNAFGVSIGESGSGSGIERMCIGSSCGNNATENRSICIGILSAGTGAKAYSTSIGFQSGYNNAAQYSLNLGFECGYSGSASYSINLGYRANYLSFSGGPSIVLNASSTSLNASASGLYIQPVRSITNAPESVYYNNSTKEITFQKAGQLPSYTTAQRLALTGLSPGFLCYDSDLLQLGLWAISWRMI
jgi:hypothetical protein